MFDNSEDREELLGKLAAEGLSWPVEMIVNNHKKCFTSKGRPNFSGMCRVLGWNRATLDAFFLCCREIIGDVEYAPPRIRGREGEP
jgi:hypothetical protein